MPPHADAIPPLTKSNIAVVRRAVGLNQTVCAVKAGISRTALQNIESGRSVPREETLRALALAMGVAYVPDPPAADEVAMPGNPAPVEPPRAPGAGAGAEEVA